MTGDGAVMIEVIPFPLRSRVHLVRSFADDLETLNGEAANLLWRSRVKQIVAELRASDLGDAAIREEIVALQWAVQGELQERSLARVDSESVARA